MDCQAAAAPKHSSSILRNVWTTDALGEVGPITIDPQFTRYQLRGESRIPRREHRFARTIEEGLPPAIGDYWWLVAGEKSQAL